MTRFASAVAITFFALCCEPARATNLLTNGSFETGDFTGWTLGGNLSNPAWVIVVSHATSPVASFYPEDGTYFLAEGPTQTDATIQQTFTDVAGGTLQVSGWLQGGGGSPSDFGMSINGQQYVTVNPVPLQPWTQYSFSVAATGSDTLLVNFRHDPGWDAIDNLVVTETFAAPEPGAAAWAVGAMGTLAGAMRRRRSAR